MAVTRWGIIGPGTIAHNFADGLQATPFGELVAIASRDETRLEKFGERYTINTDRRYADYASLVNDSAIDAIYIATLHPWHAEHAILALRAGKAVLCEKPAGMTASQVVAVTEVAGQEGQFFMEALMYRSHPQIARVLEIISSGELGDVQQITAAFGFQAGFNAGSRLYDKALGGGGILDVGCYPVSFARLIAGAAIGLTFDNPKLLKAVGRLGKSGVDEIAYATLTFASGITAVCSSAITFNFENSATVVGSKGRLVLPDPWMPGRDARPSTASLMVMTAADVRCETITRDEHLFTFEAEVASRAIQAGKQQADSPAMSWADSIGNAEALDRWRHEIGYQVLTENHSTNRVLPGVMPAKAMVMPTISLPGVKLPVSKLMLGCDNRDTLADGAIVWDAWMEAGGNAFDTAHIYNAGLNEQVLGDWIRNRGVADSIVVTAKGAHTPNCTPAAIEKQLDESLSRLGLEQVPIYLLHRDNPAVPVGEFIDALNRLHNAGRIGVFGGSNWTVERFLEANAYAASNGLQPMRLLNNNLSLAVMEKPVWPGCISSSSLATRRVLQEQAVVHFSWSSQARGFFLAEQLRHRLPADTSPETCFGSKNNSERRRRAEALGAERGVTANAIALAWVLTQPFPSFALVGSRSPGEIVSSLPALHITLDDSERAWLNLEQEKH